jgi:hypothetical protein
MRSDLLSSHLDVIGNIHHASVVHWRFSTKLSSSVSTYRSLFLVCLKVLRFLFICSLFNFSREHSLHSSDVEFRLMDVADNIMTYIEISLVYLEQSIIIVFSLHLREPLVLDLVMLSFISLPYTVLHHDFQFFCLIAFSEFISG